jgi:hypothetical protein
MGRHLHARRVRDAAGQRDRDLADEAEQRQGLFEDGDGAAAEILQLRCGAAGSGHGGQHGRLPDDFE